MIMFIRPKRVQRVFERIYTVADSTTLAGKRFQLFIVLKVKKVYTTEAFCMWLIDFVVMAPGGIVYV